MTTQKLCPNCFQKGTYLGGRCEKCGYVKENRPQCALPEDYVCPICKHPASDFEKIVR